MSPLISPIANVAKGVLPTKLPISPLEGQMSGRTEGGGQRIDVCRLTHACSVG